MTNEQASEILDDYDVNFHGHTAEEVAQAFDCAFKALEQQPCEDAISRKAAIDVMATWDWQELYLPIHFKQLLEDLPSVRAEKTGRWKRVSIDKYIQHAMAFYKCSECGGQTIGQTEYCPNCGAKMQEVEE